MFGASRPLFVLALGLFALATAPVASAQPIAAAAGKNTQAIADCVHFDANDEATISVTVPYGRKNRMLLVKAFTRGMPAPQECSQSLVLTVGPPTGESFGGSVTGRQGGSYTATGQWWTDLDANEAAYPGSYVGVPVPVQLVVHRHVGDPCDIACISLDVQMVKK